MTASIALVPYMGFENFRAKPKQQSLFGVRAWVPET
jgi:hypothetical protein